MKKLFISFALFAIATTGFSQVLKPVKIDSLVTVSLPTDYQKKDTLGQQIYSANGLVGFFEVIKAANVKNTAPLKNQKDLNKVFNEYIKTILAQSNKGTTKDVRDTIIGTLKAKLFTLVSEDNTSQVQLRNMVLIYTTEATYTFEYTYPEFRKDLIKDEYKVFISSIKFAPNLQRNDQYLFNAKGGMTILAKMALLSSILLIVIIIIAVVRRKKKRNKRKR
ncbi:MAG TPA: hypothetical protein VGC01_06400 [Mucilaginibacter sp.]